MASLRRWLPALLAAVILALTASYYALTEPVTTVHRVAPDVSVQRDPPCRTALAGAT